MTCPIDDLPEFDLEHWDVCELCSLMRCPECTAEDGEGVFFEFGGSAECDSHGRGYSRDCDGMPF